MNVTKMMLVRQISDKYPEITHINLTINTALVCIRDFLVQGKNVELRGFGSFKVMRRKPRPAMNPKSPEQKIMLPQRLVPVFKFSRQIKKKLNGGEV